MLELGVNIDHIATIRQARKTYEPDPVTAAAMAELGGADCITVHLREDRRHIIDRDVRILAETVNIKLNLEMSVANDIVDIACLTKPNQVTLVPEKREEVTTEGGLDVTGNYSNIETAVKRLQDAGVSISLFLDPEEAQIDAAHKLQVDAIELHTGQYALSSGSERKACLSDLITSGQQIVDAGITLHAGHGLNYQNLMPVARIDNMVELNIGHSIISRAVFVGLTQAVREMKQLLVIAESEHSSQ